MHTVPHPAAAEFWDARYESEAYAYGTEPNTYFRQQLDKLPPGRLLLLAEGEGRNAVYAARHGWQVTAVDFSDEARAKAQRLAVAQGVHLDYQVDDVTSLRWQQPGHYDAIGLIYAHLPPVARWAVHAAAAQSLAPGGQLFLEAFSPRQLGLPSGGPKSAELLYTPDILAQDFMGLTVRENHELGVVLHEGSFHSGPANIVRLLATRS
ncbi:class I SAM-dependent methyltransferase [Hymenobacter taeanensis]|uniref:Class I SAM-dependent methyltransferase n=1 Tax=Hymenobacter taeanensis TaxID=2735321 RepID=A0A6M6BL41_9BACT|nr:MULTISPECIES: class I SAM-dependent methyltransferase [Hymenobacter]QJX47795.1 class I SAM-dependent methyltransferase [Hymenobacter taeanensis]UOQ82717.1 class I SAM-dependent methyltransferase [Hymenobacter sp. 5414T-23]